MNAKNVSRLFPGIIAAALVAALAYAAIPGLRAEAAHTLGKFRPATLGQAARLAGVTPAGLMVVSVALHKAQPTP